MWAALVLCLVVRAGRGDPGDDDGRLVFKSMLKTGSAIVFERLRVANLPMKHLGEREGIARAPADYVVAGVREPCSWLVSAWAWASNPERDSIVRKCSRRGGDAPSWEPGLGTRRDLASAPAVAEFRTWVRAHPGVMTHWFFSGVFSSLPRPPAPRLRGKDEFRPDRYADALAPRRGGDAAAPFGRLADFDWCAWRGDGDGARLAAAMARRPVDCWVRTATLDDDVDACLARAGERLGAPVDWDAYERRKYRPRDHLNVGRKGACAAYFDAALLDFVYEAERAVFDAFNYTRDACCALGDADRSEL